MTDDTHRADSVPCDAEIAVTRNARYGTANVGYHSPSGLTPRSLLMDIYEPELRGNGARPAIVFAFGGAFHRGAKEDDRVIEGGGENTPISDYCRALAMQGYVCFAIDYRLTPEDPDPGNTPVLLNREAINRSRIDHVRGLMGLPASSAQMMGDAIEAAIDDMEMAVVFVSEHAARWHIDRNRIAVAGFSAGAIMAIATAYATPVRVNAVVSLSGAMGLMELEKYLMPRTYAAPGIFIHGSNDLDGIGPGSALLCERLRNKGVLARRYVVEGGTHFYKSNAMATRPDDDTHGDTSPLRVIDAISTFLKDV